MKKRVLSTIMSLAMLASAAPMAIAENSTTPEIIDLLRDGTTLRPGVNVTSNCTIQGGEISSVTNGNETDGGVYIGCGKTGYFQVDLGTVRSITEVTFAMSASWGEWRNREFDVYLSNDPTFTDDPTVVDDVVKVCTADALGYLEPQPRKFTIQFDEDSSVGCGIFNKQSIATTVTGDDGTETTTGSRNPVSVTVNGPKQYRYIRLQKNIDNSGLSLSEVSVKGYNEYYEQDLTHMSGVTATSNANGYEDTDPDNMYNYVKTPSNVIDGKYEVQTKESGDTRVDDKYTAFIADFTAADPYVQVDLTAVRELSRVKVLPYRGSEANPDVNGYLRKNIMVWASNNENFEDAKVLYNGAGKTETRDQWIDIDLSNTADYYRYIRVGLSDETAKLGVTEIIALGYDVFDVEVPESTVPVGRTDVTNVGTTTIPTVKTGMALDRATVNSNTVYALRQVPVAEVKDADGNVTTPAGTKEVKTTINPVILDDYTIGIDLATLLSYNEYKIVVDGVKTTTGMDIKPYTSGIFKTAIIVPVAYKEGTTVANIAQGKKAYSQKYTKGESGEVTKEQPIALTRYVDGNVGEGTVSVNQSGQILHNYSETTPNYAYIDLGSARKIAAVGNQGGDGSFWYHFAPMTFYGTNTDPTTVANPVTDANTVKLAEITQSQVEIYNTAVSMWGKDVAEKGKWSETFAPATAVQSNDSYRYIIMAATEHGPKMPSEVMVYTAYTVEDVVQSVSIKDGARGVTNVSNAQYYNVWDGADSTFKTYVNNGAPIEIKFTSSVDMSTVNNNSVKLSKVYKANSEAEEVLTKVEYTPIIDNENKTLKIDLSELDAYQGTVPSYVAQHKYSYRMEITSDVTNADGSIVARAGRLVDFETGEIAKTPYVEGKTIKNVAKGKTVNMKSAYSAGSYGIVDTYNPSFTNGYVGAGDDNFTESNKIPQGNAILLDLGNVFDVASIGFLGGTEPYHNGYLDFYFSNDAVYDKTGTADYAAKNDSKNIYHTAKVNVEDSRYVLIENNSPDGSDVNNRFIKELMVYAYVDTNKPELYFTSPKSYKDDTKKETVTTLRAKAENAAGKTLILAEYDENGALVKTTSKGAAEQIEVTPVEGHTYKAFVWDSLTGLTPAAKAVQY